MSPKKKAQGDDLIGMVIPFIVLGAIAGSVFFYNLKKQQGAEIVGVGEKFIQYRNANIFRWALVEGACLLSMIFYFLVIPSFLILIAFAIGLGALAFFRPSADGFRKDFGLTNQEAMRLN